MKRSQEANSLYIVIPAYNEGANIKTVIEDWYPIVESHGTNSQLVVIDDGSKDNTYKIMKKLAKTRPLLKAITKPNSGHGATILYGYHYALDHHAKFIFQTDSDGQTLPSEFEKFWKLRDQYDMVIGWRKGRQDGFSRIVVTKVLKITIKLFFGVSVIDANTPFRLMKASTLSKYIGMIPVDFNLSNVAISAIYAKKSLKVKFLPITFRPRQGGTNSINLKKIFGIGKQAVVDFRKINKEIKKD